jgi:hypothetical protein
VSNRRVARGHLTHVQEQRFRIATNGGSNLLLTLAHTAPLDSAELQQLVRDRTPVVVEYEGEPGLASGVAHEVRRA